MILSLMLSTGGSIVMFVLCTFIYRNTKMTDVVFTLLMILLGVLTVAFVMVSLGISMDEWRILAIFIIPGAALGFQTARVIIRSRQVEVQHIDGGNHDM